MDTEILDFSSPLEIFDRKRFARHPKVINKYFFLKKSFFEIVFMDTWNTV